MRGDADFAAAPGALPDTPGQACRRWDRGRAPWRRCRPARARCPRARRACACGAPRKISMSNSGGNALAAMRTSSCATATPMEVLGATSTAMSRDAPATRASNSAPWPVVPITIGTRAARQTLSARRLSSGREKSMATCAPARDPAVVRRARARRAASSPATSPMSRPADLLPGDATAATTSRDLPAATLARTMAAPMRPVAPINAALVTFAPVHTLHGDSVPQRAQSCETAAP